MRKFTNLFLSCLFCLTFLVACDEPVDFRELEKRRGIFYKKSTDIPFTGEVKGETEGTFKNGRKGGAWVGYGSNGQLVWERNFKNGKMVGRWVKYHSNGQLWSKGNIKDGKKDGSWVFYTKDGTMKKFITGTYRKGKKID